MAFYSKKNFPSNNNSSRNKKDRKNKRRIKITKSTKSFKITGSRAYWYSPKMYKFLLTKTLGLRIVVIWLLQVLMNSLQTSAIIFKTFQKMSSM